MNDNKVSSELNAGVSRREEQYNAMSVPKRGLKNPCYRAIMLFKVSSWKLGHGASKNQEDARSRAIIATRTKSTRPIAMPVCACSDRRDNGASCYEIRQQQQQQTRDMLQAAICPCHHASDFRRRCITHSTRARHNVLVTCPASSCPSDQRPIDDGDGVGPTRRGTCRWARTGTRRPIDPGRPIVIGWRPAVACWASACAGHVAVGHRADVSGSLTARGRALAMPVT